MVASGGAAGHGSTSPFDVHNMLIAAGPDLKTAAVLSTPSGSVDFAPTFLHLLGIAAPPSMQGRVLHEALARGTAAEALASGHARHQVRSADGSYTLTAFFSTVDVNGRSHRYLDCTKVERR
jgi:arylsulfatase A-like enzyme